MKPIPQIFDKTMGLLYCLSLIQENYMNNNSFILLVNSELLLDVPVFRLNYTQQMSTARLFGRKFDFYLIDCSSFFFKDFMDVFSSQPSFSSASHFIFFCQNMKEETLSVLRNFAILNMVFLNTSSGEILTYFPYKQRLFRNFNVSLSKIGFCDMNNKSKTNRLVQLFPNKIPKIWDNSTVNIFHSFAPPYTMGIKDELGIELDLQISILERMGARPNFTKIYLPEVGKKRTITRILKGNECDYMIGVSSPTSYFQPTVPYLYDDLMWYVPSARELPKWKYLLSILDKTVWLCWMLSSMSAIASLYINDIFLHKEYRIFNLLDKFCMFFRLFLEQSVSFRTKYFTEIILIAVFIFGTFMMNLIYKSKFFFSLTAVRYEDDLNSLEDFMNSGLKIGFVDWHIAMFEDNKKLISYLKNNFQSCNLQANCSDQAAFERNLAVLRPRFKMLYWTRRYMDKKGRSLLWRVEQPVADLFWVGAFFPGHPLFDVVNQYILYYLDYGLVIKIASKYTVEVYRNNEFPETRRLSLSLVEVPLVFWMFGMVTGIVVLFFEVKCKPGRKYRGRY